MQSNLIYSCYKYMNKFIVLFCTISSRKSKLIIYLHKNDRNCDRFCNDENFFCRVVSFKVVTNVKALKPFKTYKE